jgi:GDP-L-fucose synthase
MRKKQYSVITHLVRLSILILIVILNEINILISSDKKINLNSKIFIAGHKGLVGSAIYKKFKIAGYKNLLIPDRSYLDLTNINDTRSYLIDNKPDYMILAAGYTGGILENKNHPDKLLRINLQIQLNALSVAYETNIKKTIFFGSSCMYPKYCKQPIKEDFLLMGKPDDNSLSYALAKLTGLQMCSSYNAMLGTNNFISIIPNTVYGPNDNFNPDTGHVLSALISRFHKAKILGLNDITLWGSGNAKREFLFSDDLAEMCMLIIEKENSLNSIINIGSGYEITIKNLSKEIAKTVGFEGKINWDKSFSDGVKKKLLSSDRAHSFGWKPKTSLLEGLKKTYNWFLENQK